MTNFGIAIVDGDSGSWVVDEKTHEVYGHLVASDMFGEGYVIPLYATFHDMQIRLDVESVDLPSAIDIACTTIEGVGSLLVSSWFCICLNDGRVELTSWH